MINRRIRPGWIIVTVASLMLAFSAPAHLQQMPDVIVGPIVQISAAHSSLSHAEFLAGADPNNSRRLIVCSMMDSPNRTYPVSSVVYMSSDGGTTWSAALDLNAVGVPYMSDPKCAFGPNGIAYYAGYGTNPRVPYGGKQKPTDPGLSEYFFSTRNGGKTWSKPTTIIGNRLGRASLAVDNSKGPRRGTIYWDGVVVVEDYYEKHWSIGYTLFQSTDEGAHFQSSVLHAPHSRIDIGLIGGNSVVLGDGTFVSIFTGEPFTGDPAANVMDSLTLVGDTANKALVDHCNIFSTTSTDGGISITTPVRVSACHRTELLQNGHRTAGFPALAAGLGNGPYHDRLYLVWTDNRSGRHDVLLCTSDNRGASWSAPKIINDDRSSPNPADGPDMMHATVAVNPQGIVGIAWAQRQSANDSGNWRVRFRASVDGGNNFTPSVLVSQPLPHTRPAITNKKRKPSAVDVLFMYDGGHTWSMVADARGVFHPIWVDRTTGSFQLWTTTVRVR